MIIMRRHVVCLVAWPLNESPVICVLFFFLAQKLRNIKNVTFSITNY